MSDEPMTRDRGLAACAVVLGRDFLPWLEALGPAAHWIDAGAGEAVAQREYLERRRAAGARVTAIDERPPSLPLPHGLRAIRGSIENLAAADVGRADLITDVYGPLQYSHSPDVVLARYAEWLVPGGRLWAATPAATFIVAAAGEIELAEWIRTVRGFDVVRCPTGAWERELILERNREPPRVPRLELVVSMEGPPPLRRFRQPDPWPAPRLRRMEPGEIEVVAALWRRSRTWAMPDLGDRIPRSLADDLQRLGQLAGTGEIWLAIRDGIVLGMMTLVGRRIDQLYVEPSAIGQGIGTALLKQARTLSPEGLTLHTHQRNVTACRFYERHGFRPVHRGISPPPEGEPDVLYAWEPEGGDRSSGSPP